MFRAVGGLEFEVKEGSTTVSSVFDRVFTGLFAALFGYVLKVLYCLQRLTRALFGLLQTGFVSVYG